MPVAIFTGAGTDTDAGTGTGIYPGIPLSPDELEQEIEGSPINLSKMTLKFRSKDGNRYFICSWRIQLCMLTYFKERNGLLTILADQGVPRNINHLRQTKALVGMNIRPINNIPHRTI